MKENPRLIVIKFAHTLIWVVMVFAIFYTVYAGVVDRLDVYLWFAVGLIILEVVVLSLNNWVCPFTNMAKKYLDDWEMGDDMYLPRWIGTHNRELFGPLLVLGLILV